MDVFLNWLSPTVTQFKQRTSISKDDIKISKPPCFNVELNGHELQSAYNSNTDKSLIRLFLSLYKSDIIKIVYVIPFIAFSSFCAPLCIMQFEQQLLPQKFFSCTITEQTFELEQMNYSQGLLYIFGLLWPYLVLIGIGQLIRSCSDSYCAQICTQLGLKINSGLLQCIFNKMLQISETSKFVNAQGSLSNILFSDTTMIQLCADMLYMLIYVPIDMIVCIIYLILFTNPTALIGLCGFLIFIPLISIFDHYMSKSIYQMTTLRDQRSNRILEMLNAMKVVKLFNQEQFQERRIINGRIQEQKIVKQAHNYFALHEIIGNSSSNIMMIIAVASMLATDTFNISVTFTMLYLYCLMEYTIALIPLLIMYITDAFVAQKRIQAFLILPEIDREQYQKTQINKIDKLAIQISGNNDYAYGLEQDYASKAELDPQYWFRVAKYNQMLQNEKHIIEYFKTQEDFTSRNATKANTYVNVEDIETITTAVNNNTFVLNSIVNQKICDTYQLPPISYFMNIFNYSEQYFQKQVNDSQKDEYFKNYLHMCIVQYFKYITQQFYYEKPKIYPVLKNLNLNIQQGQLIGVLGAVGSGKSSLFYCILGELKPIHKDELDSKDFDHSETKPLLVNNQQQFISNNRLLLIDTDTQSQKLAQQVHIKINGNVAFCPQAAPIFSATIRENICFFRLYDEAKYNKIIDICCLLPDFKQFNAGDLTEVGCRGMTLSGGQRARISLARALYSDADIYLLDDPLSAVDAYVGKKIWDEVIVNYLKGKTVIIASHQTHYFQDCDRILTIENGQLTVDEQNVQKNNITIMDQTVNDVKINFQNSNGKLVEDEALVETGSIKISTYTNYINSGYFCWFLLFILLLIAEQCCLMYSYVVISDWGSDKYGWSAEQYKNQIPIEYQQILDYEISLYGNYSYVNSATFSCYQNFWLVNYNVTIQSLINYSDDYFYLYIGVSVLMIAFLGTWVFALLKHSITAAKTLFKQAVHAIIYTKQAFFDVTPQGRIMNRLGKDTEQVDFILPRIFILTIFQFAVAIAMAVLDCVLSWPCIIIILPCFALYILIYSKYRGIRGYNIKRCKIASYWQPVAQK